MISYVFGEESILKWDKNSLGEGIFSIAAAFFTIMQDYNIMHVRFFVSRAPNSLFSPNRSPSQEVDGLH